MTLLRCIASPPLPSTVVDDMCRRFSSAGKLLACTSDCDVNATCISINVEDGGERAALTALSNKWGAAAAGRAFRVDLQQEEAAGTFSDEAVRALAVDLHGALQCPVYVARRAVAASAWKSIRPMGWGPQGLELGDCAPTLPFSGSQSVGAAIEVGASTVIIKAIVKGVDDAQLRRIAVAVGGPDSGFAELGAYPLGTRGGGQGVIVLELGDIKRTPPHRVLTVLEIEARRFGGFLGAGALLSHIPLSALLDSLASNIGLHAQPAQVIETHLDAALSP
ncbi:MAG: hypothetical protein DLM53_12305 [Candidatus Eremiobacter antarcticus]|nr:hypothetical protein [Candidatus Eremiobacteraeota bacterium]MBC5808881.1 hypothetical protein [Candidatus Eremiobacteraeota bacterium]PZR60434.1 MAG: hypothetical protein DLM53_12305 [Candidatus Eremiobacter sp. RRmetagenome_bin22]